MPQEQVACWAVFQSATSWGFEIDGSGKEEHTAEALVGFGSTLAVVAAGARGASGAGLAAGRGLGVGAGLAAGRRLGVGARLAAGRGVGGAHGC